ncbi:MAG TPA: hypothetical protein GXX75_00420 [Clostridiales bacterium]|nr:hypothetical protein [Clostridiales bacterium]
MTEHSRIISNIESRYSGATIEFLPVYPGARTIDMLLFKCTRTSQICVIAVADLKGTG